MCNDNMQQIQWPNGYVSYAMVNGTDSAAKKATTGAASSNSSLPTVTQTVTATPAGFSDAVAVAEASGSPLSKVGFGDPLVLVSVGMAILGIRFRRQIRSSWRPRQSVR